MDKSLPFINAIHAHKSVDKESKRSRTSCKQITGMYIYSNNYHLVGRADLVEWRNGLPIPVETKTGKVRNFENFNVQIGLQTICLEEMYNVTVSFGEIFFTEERRRSKIAVDKTLKDRCITVVSNLQDCFLSFNIKRFPRVNDHRCTGCQYQESCLPSILE
jgi:CRISPR-associated exonuclease Cas4